MFRNFPLSFPHSKASSCFQTPERQRNNPGFKIVYPQAVVWMQIPLLRSTISECYELLVHITVMGTISGKRAWKLDIAHLTRYWGNMYWIKWNVDVDLWSKCKICKLSKQIPPQSVAVLCPRLLQFYSPFDDAPVSPGDSRGLWAHWHQQAQAHMRNWIGLTAHFPHWSAKQHSKVDRAVCCGLIA